MQACSLKTWLAFPRPKMQTTPYGASTGKGKTPSWLGCPTTSTLVVHRIFHKDQSKKSLSFGSRVSSCRRVSGSYSEVKKAVLCAQCMSFVPAPQQANAAVTAVKQAPAAAPAADGDNGNSFDIHKLRTFDVYWVEKKALMYKDGYAKVCSTERKGYLHQIPKRCIFLIMPSLFPL